MTKSVPSVSEPNLPAAPSQVLPALAEITSALGIPREVLASDDDIVHAWNNLPRELRAIPQEVRGELIARMCVAVSTGLFDGAINYAWNATILHLREMIREFGTPVVSHTIQRNFEEKDLIELTDANLLDLCLKLGLISEDGFFFLNQCRETRNNFSAAHPTIGNINDREFIIFLNRCARYALSADAFPKGIDVSAFISAVRGTRFSELQLDTWLQRLDGTHDAQRQLLFGMLHGIYCDPENSELVRLNALDICTRYFPKLSSTIKSDLVERHSNYIAKGDTQRHTASQKFFENLAALFLLNESERHGVFSHALTNLWRVHQEMNNFYNEPPFAERLRAISEQGSVPETIQEKYVETVVGCRIGNGYGVSWSAADDYDEMIKNFSPKEISIMLSLPKGSTIVGRRIRNCQNCWEQFKRILLFIDGASVSSNYQGVFQKLKGGYLPAEEA